MRELAFVLVIAGFVSIADERQERIGKLPTKTPETSRDKWKYAPGGSTLEMGKLAISYCQGAGTRALGEMRPGVHTCGCVSQCDTPPLFGKSSCLRCHNINKNCKNTNYCSKILPNSNLVFLPAIL